MPKETIVYLALIVFLFSKGSLLTTAQCTDILGCLKGGNKIIGSNRWDILYPEGWIARHQPCHVDNLYDEFSKQSFIWQSS